MGMRRVRVAAGKSISWQKHSEISGDTPLAPCLLCDWLGHPSLASRQGVGGVLEKSKGRGGSFPEMSS